MEIIGALMAEQKVKNNIWNELENPTHHHTQKQILNLKEFCSLPSATEIWNAFMEWTKNGSRAYHTN